MVSSKARALRRTQTEAEQRLWALLRNRGLGGAKFRRQHPVERYILDFACVGVKVAVEADGAQHVDDHVRDGILGSLGWRVLRFTNAEILDHADSVCAAILAALTPSYADIAAAAARHGLLARGGVATPDHGTVVLIGTAGSEFWPHFQAARRDEADPLDAWSRRVIGALAERFGARPLLPQDGPPFLPFQRWAMAAEAVYPSPMGVLVHPEYGLWHSYRGALAFDGPLDLSPRADRPNPCEGCADTPCIAACPVGAAAPYDVPKCKSHLEAGGACRRIGCLPRHACPLGQDYAYVPEQASFHMEAFLTAMWC